MSATQIRLARFSDLDALVEIEKTAFKTDRFHRDQVEYLLTRSHGTILVLEHEGVVVGSAFLLWRRAMVSGRLYNLAVLPSHQGHGFGTLLLEEAELETARRGCESLLLEVRCDNTPGIEFYKRCGYTITSVLPDYYEDHSSGYKMSKPLDISVPDRVRLDVPYYAQMLDFTCGPACLMMAIKYFHPNLAMNPTQEINLWREATLVFMTAGIGGTGPHGLALSARRRGLETRLWLSSERTPFRFSVRDKKKREVIEIAHRDLFRRAAEAGVDSAVFDFTFKDIVSAIFRGMVPIVLASAYRLTGDRVPHWVVVTGFDRQQVYLQDPDLESYDGNRRRARCVRISCEEFQRISRYGKDAIRSTILVGPPL